MQNEVTKVNYSLQIGKKSQEEARVRLHILMWNRVQCSVHYLESGFHCRRKLEVTGLKMIVVGNRDDKIKKERQKPSISLFCNYSMCVGFISYDQTLNFEQQSRSSGGALLIFT